MTDLVYAFAALPAETRLADLPPGLEGLPVEIVPAGGLTLVVQRTPADLAERLESVQDAESRAWLTDCVVQHERVVEACLNAGPVFPFGFGIMFESRAALAEALAPHKTTLEGYFRRTRDRKEWAVKVYAGIDVPSRRTVAEGAASGRDYLEKRHRSPFERGDAMEAARKEAQQLIDRLAGQAANVVAREAGSAPLASSTTVLVANSAFLVDDEQNAEFREAAATFDPKDWSHLVDVTVSGPWPPYSFRPEIRLGTR
jgi:hypothetical protein